MLSFLLKCDIKDVCTDALGLSSLHPQCFASSAGAVLGTVLDPLQAAEAVGAVFSDTQVQSRGILEVEAVDAADAVVAVFSQTPSEFISRV